MTALAPIAWYGTRIALVAMFPFSAIDKVWHWNASLRQTRSGGLPGARTMLISAIIVELVTPLMVVSGWWDRLGALLLAGFCIVTAFLYHPFWRWPDFWSPRDDSVAREHFWQFLKNFGLVGGLALIMFGNSIDDPLNVLRHPLTSSAQGSHSSAVGPDDSVDLRWQHR